MTSAEKFTEKGLHNRRMKHCDRHDGLAVPECGVDLGVRWICAKCWLEVQSGRQLRSINRERSKKAA
jgi:hypothetical protein